MIRLIKPYISFEEVEESFKDIFASGLLTKGEYVGRFQKKIADYTGASYAFLTTSATTALSMALKIYGVGVGDEVIVSDFSFPATVNVVEDLGAVPVFADVDTATFNMLPSELTEKISSRTKAVIFVDAFGNPSGIGEIKAICEQHKLPLIEDAACAIGSSENGVMCGNIADITCFSFHPRKLLTTGEGGAITTNDPAVAEKLEIKLNHGGQVDKDGNWSFIDYGYNFRMNELQAAMGLVQLGKLDFITEERRAIRQYYVNELEKIGFQAQKISKNVRHNVQSVVFVVPKEIERNRLICHLRVHEIETTIGTYCLSSLPYYQKKFRIENLNAPRLEKETITLPCYQQVDIDTVADAIRLFYIK